MLLLEKESNMLLTELLLHEGKNSIKSLLPKISDKNIDLFLKQVEFKYKKNNMVEEHFFKNIISFYFVGLNNPDKDDLTPTILSKIFQSNNQIAKDNIIKIHSELLYNLNSFMTTFDDDALQELVSNKNINKEVRVNAIKEILKESFIKLKDNDEFNGSLINP